MENKNGQGIFYGVIGVATLIVAIIGATFAYFTATTTTNYKNALEGNTLTVGGNDLSLTVERVAFTGAHAPSLDLVPAEMNENTSGYTTALGAKCENLAGTYTGCHLYKITAHTANQLSGVTITADKMITTAATKTNWKYVVYTGSESSVTSLVGTTQTFGASPDGTTSTILNAGALNAGDTVYYLLVYLLNVDSSQNGVSGGTDETGHYSGQVNLSLTGGGHISASFTS